MADAWHQIPGFLRSPNISGDWRLYEVENRAADPDGTIERAMRNIAAWDDAILIDIGAGTGYHIERFHHEAAHVIAVEPDADLRLEMMQRVAAENLTRTSVIGASAAALPLRDHSVDIAHARFAYFFGPGCEPGLAELERVVRPGGTAFIIDNDLRSGTFASWLQDAYGGNAFNPEEIETFWDDQGFTIERLSSCWRFETRDDLERVIHLEFPPEHAARFVASHSGLEVDYNLLLMHKTYHR
ncbi:MAG TPA: class I SAM-dependent methyltransferase [Thermomicrobiales bacterium]|nr:class I SAM-dependent methyltransferase [Thermomicrobiales bacterium]